ncbi:hypothetical protein [Geomobilimonas luticola]|uniref:Uncharacterized protein n=1 Tax=Geomobilimonas luticola TaxID=1114878 RepID=A0ABS5SI34_9BACT|nr:hypothetical protein [Geomobilimonas luticola]MBT0654299.1 hypothetical protein [Geomobilimonas luticola]
MKKFLLAALAVLAFTGAAAGAGGLDGFLSNLNIQARADLSGFAGRISAQFGIPGAQVNTVIGTVKDPADAFMIYQLGQMANVPPDRVMQVYQSKQGKGWGVIAKSLGIKPGSREFHALKRGDFVLSGQPANSPAGPAGYGPGKGKGRGHNK